LDHFKVLFNTPENVDALNKLSIKAKSIPSSLDNTAVDLTQVPAYNAILDDVVVHGSNLGSYTGRGQIGVAIEQVANSGIAKHFNTNQIDDMLDFPIAIRAELQALRDDGYFVIGQARTSHISESSFAKPDYLFIRIDENTGMVDPTSLRYWDAKHATNADYSPGQLKHIVDYIESGGEALVNITSIPSTIKGINNVDEVVSDVPEAILDISNDEILTILSANKIGSYLDNGVIIFGKQ